MGGPTSAGSTGKIDVDVSDQTTRPVVVKFNEVQKSTTLSADAVKGARTITLTNTTGFVDGRYIILFNVDNSRFSFMNQIGAPVGNVVTIDTPLECSFPSGTFVDSTITNMNVDGSGTARTFGLRGTGSPPGVDLKVDITRIIFHMVTDSAINLLLFGNITALTRGIVLRRRNDITENIFNLKNNGEIAGTMFDFDVQEAINPAQGVDGFVSRLTFAGQNKIGVAVRLPVGDDLELIIQDDLTDLTLFEIVAEGHIVEDR
jgi:hypothetical protein